MKNRMIQAKYKNASGCEFDNIDTYKLDADVTGFPLTEQDQIDYSIWLANEAHSLGLAVLQKNALDLVDTLEPYYDGLLTEQSEEYHESDRGGRYIVNNKAHFNAEYLKKYTDPKDLTVSYDIM